MWQKYLKSITVNLHFVDFPIYSRNRFYGLQILMKQIQNTTAKFGFDLTYPCEFVFVDFKWIEIDLTGKEFV